MTLVGHRHLVYLPTPAFREVMQMHIIDPDEYGSIYKVRGTRLSIIRPKRSELDAAHWAMFLALLATDYEELREIAVRRGFESCWQVHELDIESGDDVVADARSLTVP